MAVPQSEESSQMGVPTGSGSKPGSPASLLPAFSLGWFVLGTLKSAEYQHPDLWVVGSTLLTTGNLIRWVSDRPFVLLFRCHGTLIVPYEMIDHIMSTPGEFATYDLLQPDVVSSPILIPRLHLLRLLPPGRLFPCQRSPGQVGTTVKSEV